MSERHVLSTDFGTSSQTSSENSPGPKTASLPFAIAEGRHAEQGNASVSCRRALLGPACGKTMCAFETMKMRVLNAGHQVVANPGELPSIGTIAE